MFGGLWLHQNIEAEHARGVGVEAVHDVAKLVLGAQDVEAGLLQGELWGRWWKEFQEESSEFFFPYIVARVSRRRFRVLFPWTDLNCQVITYISYYYLAT